MWQRAVMSGGGAVVKTGTFTLSSASEVKTISTGLSKISKLYIHGYSTSNYGYSLQQSIYYDADDPGYALVCAHYSNAGAANRTANGLSIERCLNINAISGGNFSVKAASNAAWAPTTFTWLAI